MADLYIVVVIRSIKEILPLYVHSAFSQVFNLFGSDSVLTSLKIRTYKIGLFRR